MKRGVEASASFYGATNSPLAVFDGGVAGFKTVNWSITPSTKYPADGSCPNPGGMVDAGLKQGSEVIPMIAPGTRPTPLQNQIDVGFRKVFKIRGKYTPCSNGIFRTGVEPEIRNQRPLNGKLEVPHPCEVSDGSCWRLWSLSPPPFWGPTIHSADNSGPTGAVLRRRSG